MNSMCVNASILYCFDRYKSASANDRFSENIFISLLGKYKTKSRENDPNIELGDRAYGSSSGEYSGQIRRVMKSFISTSLIDLCIAERMPVVLEKSIVLEKSRQSR